MKPPAKLPRWRVIEIAKKGRHVATLSAPSAEAANRKAIEDYGIAPDRHHRLAAQAIVET